MKKWEILKWILVEKLVFWWKWFAKLKSENKDLDWRTIFITWWAIPWSVVDLRLLKKRKDYLETQILNIVKKSPIEKIHKNNPYWECGWCKWVNIEYKEQLKIKQNQVKEAFFHIEKYLKDKKLNFQNIIWSKTIDWYRNKVEFSFWKYISHKEWIEEHFNVWFHKQWSFSQIQDFDWCILIDDLQNKIYKDIKDYSKKSGLEVYDQKTQKWFFRHIVIRRSFFMDEVMIIVWYNPNYENTKDLNNKIVLLKDLLISLTTKYNQIKSIYFSINENKADIAIWNLELIYWKKIIQEKLLWLKFNISPKSFFQTNSYQAEVLYKEVLEAAKWLIKNKDKFETVLDLYAWTWTIWMVFANHSKKVYSVELVKEASKDWEENAKLNNIKNIEFINKKVEDFLKDYKLNKLEDPDLIIVDPPRSWINKDAVLDILSFSSKNIIYVSCNPATLVRDLEIIMQNSNYSIEKIIPVDMFPHTHHIETIVSLKKV